MSEQTDKSSGDKPKRLAAIMELGLDPPQPGSGEPAEGALATPAREKPGDSIGPYKLLQQIGEGGCGTVYMAEQRAPIHRRVALKVIKLGMDTKQVIARFEAERQALALMDHPNIAKVLDAGATESGRPYFVMELVKGIPITRYCDENSLSTSVRLGLFIQVCHAVQHAHQKGIIHRDIKPSNILVADHDGVLVPKIIDFGIAKATTGQPLTDKTVFTAFEQFIGTAAYMSPEQAKLSGLDIDTRSDIYSLGVLLYELLTGKTPFEAERLAKAGLDEVRRIIREEEPPRPSARLHTLAAAEQTTVAKNRHAEPPKLVHLVKGDLDWIAMKAMEKDRNRRYETANGLATDIQRHLRNEPVTACPPGNLYRFQKMVRRNKLAFGAGAAVAMSLILGLEISSFLYIREKEAHRQAEHAKKQAQAAASRADAASLKAKKTLSTSQFLQAGRLIAQDRGSEAVAYLTSSLSSDPSNASALTRLITLLTYHSWMSPAAILNHSNVVRFARFSPDGTKVATASFDGTARIWDADTGQPFSRPLRHADQVSYVQFNPDGARVATGSRDKTARVWDVRTGQPLFEPFRYGDFVDDVEFSPDGQRIAVASRDGTVGIWDARTGQPLPVRPIKHGDGVLIGQFSPDGKWLLTCSWDGTARVWDAHTGEPISQPLRHDKGVRAACFSPDGTRVVTGSYDTTARVWDARTGRPLTGPLEHKGWVVSVDFSPDGKRVATGSADGTARIWDAGSGAPITEALQHAEGVPTVEFSPDGTWLLTASYDATARIWNCWTGRPQVEPMQHSDQLWSARFSLDGGRVVTASADTTARIWRLLSTRAVAQALPVTNAVAAVFSPDGRRIVVASTDGTARVFDTATSRALSQPLKHGAAVLSAQFSPDGRKIVTASDDSTAQAWDAETGQPQAAPLRHDAPVSSAQFSPDGRWIVTVAGTTARVWEAVGGRPRTGPLQHQWPVTSAQFSPDGEYILTACGDNRNTSGMAQVWDAQSGRPVNDPLRHDGTVFSARYSPDGTRIVTASGDKTARLWSAQSSLPLPGSMPMYHGDAVTSAQFSPNGRRLVTSSLGHEARVWDSNTGEPLTRPLWHDGQVWSAQFSPEGTRIVTACEDGTNGAVRVWDADTALPLTEPLKAPGEALSARFSPDGRQVLAVSSNGRVYLWDIGPTSAKFPNWPLPLAEAVSGATLNPEGVPVETKLDRIETIKQVRERLSHEPDNNDWVIWGRWFLANPHRRTISPFSKVTVPEYLADRIKEGTEQSLEEAEQLAFGNYEWLRRISEARGRGSPIRATVNR